MHAANVGTGVPPLPGPIWTPKGQSWQLSEPSGQLTGSGCRATRLPAPSGRWARAPTHRLVSTSSALTRLRSPSPVSGLFSRFHGGPRGCAGWWGLQAPLRKGRGCCPLCCPQGPGLGAPACVGAHRSSWCPPRSRVGAASRAALEACLWLLPAACGTDWNSEHSVGTLFSWIRVWALAVGTAVVPEP